ncbi:hypothetical protein E5163_04340 [Marinicauda algicola]|uniref:Nuclear transport factor 2 family protein n=1 Tax=Marinicauda algicola TaxID=2029849 RepID=A0A4S2H4L2_9PROT|nr:nuclear transport factor 2 family protein [Marinicauda algicola]TGY90358.1 hypothetical protein E5163_04340 [Marinicauda algicola]
MRVYALAAGLAGLALCTPAAPAQEGGPSPAEAAITETVMDYFIGGNEGDAARVRSAFAAENGAMYVRRVDEAGNASLEVVNLGEFAARFSSPIPVERTGEIVEITVIDDAMAFAHFRFTTPTREFDDFFLLYELDGEWTIVSKAFVAR